MRSERQRAFFNRKADPAGAGKRIPQGQSGSRRAGGNPLLPGALVSASSLATLESAGPFGPRFWPPIPLDPLCPGKKRARLPLTGAGHIPGDDLLSQDLSSHYHWRCGVSLPGSEWDRVVPPRSGHQRATLQGQPDLLLLELGLWGSELCISVGFQRFRISAFSAFTLLPAP